MRPLLLIAVLFASINSVSAQEKAVEFTSFQLSDTIYMLKGRGGNVGISAGKDGLYILDDPVVPVTDFAALPDNPNLEVIIAQYGGHCGFLKNWKLESMAEDLIAQRFMTEGWSG